MRLVIETTKRSVLSLLLLVIFSCDRKDDELCGFPEEPIVELGIVDSIGFSLIGENNIYKPSEIELSKGNQGIFLEFFSNNEDTLLGFYYTELDSGSEYYLRLAEKDTDTVNIEWKRISGNCFDTFEIISFLYNNEEIQPKEFEFSYEVTKPQ